MLVLTAVLVLSVWFNEFKPPKFTVGWIFDWICGLGVILYGLSGALVGAGDMFVKKSESEKIFLYQFIWKVKHNKNVPGDLIGSSFSELFDKIIASFGRLCSEDTL